MHPVIAPFYIHCVPAYPLYHISVLYPHEISLIPMKSNLYPLLILIPIKMLLRIRLPQTSIKTWICLRGPSKKKWFSEYSDFPKFTIVYTYIPVIPPLYSHWIQYITKTRFSWCGGFLTWLSQVTMEVSILIHGHLWRLGDLGYLHHKTEASNWENHIQ